LHGKSTLTISDSFGAEQQLLKGHKNKGQR
jgi:hypothetical protein